MVISSIAEALGLARRENHACKLKRTRPVMEHHKSGLHMYQFTCMLIKTYVLLYRQPSLLFSVFTIKNFLGKKNNKQKKKKNESSI